MCALNEELRNRILCSCFMSHTPGNVVSLGQETMLWNLAKLSLLVTNHPNLIFIDVLVRSGSITNYHRLGDLQTTETYFSHFWSLGSPRSMCWWIPYIVRAYFLIHIGLLLASYMKWPPISVCT